MSFFVRLEQYNIDSCSIPQNFRVRIRLNNCGALRYNRLTLRRSELHIMRRAAGTDRQIIDEKSRLRTEKSLPDFYLFFLWLDLTNFVRDYRATKT